MQEREIDREAAEWLVRLDDIERSVDVKEQREWITWLQRSPRHVQSYFDMATLSQSVDQVPPQGRARVRQMLSAHRSQAASLSGMRFLREDNERRPGTRLWLAAAAAVICMTTAAIWFAATRHDYSAGVGQQVAYELADGSSMLLNTRSHARVSISERERVIELDGEALFTVAHEAARPFIVRTRSAIARAVGTQFNVYAQDNGATKVSVVEGVVQVAPVASASEVHAPPLLLSAGEEAEVRSYQVARRPSQSVAASVAWQKKTLVFENATLEEVAMQFNRYNVVQFSIAPEIGAKRRLSGTFDPLRPEYFRAYLEKDDSLGVTEKDDVVRVMRR